MKQRDDTPKELSLGMIARGRPTGRWLSAAALSFAVTGCDAAAVGEARSASTVDAGSAENPTPDAGTLDAPSDAENPENPENPEPTFYKTW